MHNEYLVVLPIEPMQLGDQYPVGTPLPLHCTVMPWFRLQPSIDFAALNAVLSRLACTGKDEVELVSEAPKLFGPKNNIPVHILRGNEWLERLHAELLRYLVAAQSTPVDVRWVGTGYRPHVTDTVTTAFTSGSRCVPQGLVLIERGDDRIKRVKRCYDFAESSF